MDFLSGVVLSGVLYDMLKHGVQINANKIKNKLQDWIVDDVVAEKLELELSKLQLSNEMSESAIARKIESSPDLMSILSNIKSSPNSIINQTHTGSGDNVAGNKTIYSK